MRRPRSRTFKGLQRVRYRMHVLRKYKKQVATLKILTHLSHELLRLPSSPVGGPSVKGDKADTRPDVPAPMPDIVTPAGIRQAYPIPTPKSPPHLKWSREAVRGLTYVIR